MPRVFWGTYTESLLQTLNQRTALLSGRVLTCLAGTPPSTASTTPSSIHLHSPNLRRARNSSQSVPPVVYRCCGTADPVAASPRVRRLRRPSKQRERCVPAAAGPACVLPRTAEPLPCLCMSQIACYINPRCAVLRLEVPLATRAVSLVALISIPPLCTLPCRRPALTTQPSAPSSAQRAWPRPVSGLGAAGHR